MNNASSNAPRGWRHTLAILSVALLILLGAVFGLAKPCGGHPFSPTMTSGPGNRCCQTLADVNLKAQPSGHLVMQSCQQVTDTAGTPWQVIVYKYPHQSIDPQPLMLGLKQADSAFSLQTDVPLTAVLQDGQIVSLPYHLPTASLDWSLGSFDAQYDLSRAWPSMAKADHLTLTLPTQSTQSLEIPIPPEVLQEWHTVASCQALLCAS